MTKVAVPTNAHVNALVREGYRLVAGVDEVGRGCFAGPVTVAAVILPPRLKLDGIRDSKLLSVARRRAASVRIKRHAVGIGIGWATAAEIDAVGLTEAIRRAGNRALANLNGPYDAVLLDGNFNYLSSARFCRTLIKADKLSQSVAAASIIAKVARDSYMARLGLLYPDYGFDQHKGYGTSAHRQAIDRFGATPYHRRTWLRAISLPN